MAEQQAQRISCIVCEQPLPPKHYEGEAEPGYFPSSSIGYKAGDEGARACEDIDQLLRFMQMLNSTMWDLLADNELAQKVNTLNIKDIEMAEEIYYVGRIRDVCHLFRDLLEEAKRRFTLFDKWVFEQWKRQQQEGM